jgi:hypothetical protein
MEFEFSLLCSKENATGLYTEPYEMQFTLPPYSFDSNFSIVLPFRFRYIKLRLQVILAKTLYEYLISPVRPIPLQTLPRLLSPVPFLSLFSSPPPPLRPGSTFRLQQPGWIVYFPW